MLVSSDPVSVPHLALPLLVGPTGSFNTVQQDSEAEVEQSVAVLLGTMKGERVVAPDYGVTDPTFAFVDPNELVQTCAQWEPRAAVAVTSSPTPSGAPAVVVKVALANPSSS